MSITKNIVQGWPSSFIAKSIVHYDPTLIYEADFSGGVDEFQYPSQATASGNIDGIGGRNNCLRILSTAVSGSHFVGSLSTGVVNKDMAVRLLVRVPSSNTLVDGVRIGSPSSGNLGSFDGIPQDTWVPIILRGTVPSANLRIYMRSAGSDTFADADDILYVASFETYQFEE